MFNVRHPMKNERDLVRELADNVGHVEMLRLIATMIGHDHPDLDAAGEYKSALLRIAGKLNEETPPENQTPRQTAMEKVKQSIEAFEKVQEKYRKQGADDSEPDGIFHRIICRAATGRDPKIPSDVDGWQVYSGLAQSYIAAINLTDAARDVVKEITTAREECRHLEFAEICNYLVNYTWRIDWPD